MQRLFIRNKFNGAFVNSWSTCNLLQNRI